MGFRKFRFLSFLLLGACATSGGGQDPRKIYRKEMSVTVNGKRGLGTLVVPRETSYRIEVESRGRLDAFTITSCSREILIMDIKESGLFGSRRKYKFDYRPMKGVEEDSFCQLDLGGYDRVAGRHSWALIDFEHPDFKAPATVYCNGDTTQTVGVSICQSKAGLYQKIQFEGPVYLEYDKGCEVPEVDANGSLVFPIAHGRCYYAFQEKTGEKRFHRLTTIGYEEFLIPLTED